MKFTKIQGAGNDFILVEAGDMQWDWPETATTMCDRHFGIGADGLLLLLPSEVADFQMRIFNSDGSEAEACGNGLRCLAKYALEKGIAKTDTKEILVETIAGVRRVKFYRTGSKVTKIQASMGEPGFGVKDIPVAMESGVGETFDEKTMLTHAVILEDREFLLHLISMGNPHAVYFGQEPVVDFPLAQIGPKVEQLTIFPSGVNFEVANVISRQQIEARVWERGVGETLACGSGACAIAVAARLYDYVYNKVDIKLPGGILDVEWDGAGDVFFGGPTEMVFTGVWADRERII